MAGESKTVSPPAPTPETFDPGYAAKLGGKIRKFRDERDALKTQLEAIQKELADLKAKPVDPTAVQLRAELREFKHRQAFDQLAQEAKARPESLDALWKLSGYVPDADEIDAEKIKGLIAEQAKQPGTAYLFDGSAPAPTTPGKAPAAKLEPGPGNSRGGLVRDSGKFQVRRRGEGSVRDPIWMQQNQKAYSEALKTGNVEYVD